MTDTQPTRTLDEQFAALPEPIKARLFRVLDVTIGASQDEKRLAEHVLDTLSQSETPEPVPVLMRAMHSLVRAALLEAMPPTPVDGLIAQLQQQIANDPGGFDAYLGMTGGSDD